MGFIKEFKTFAMKGNVMDMAVGVIIGTAFGKIVSSLVDNLFTPIIAALTSGKKFEDSFKIPLTGGEEPATIKIGALLQSTIDFFIIALCIFILVKVANRARLLFEREEGPPEETAQAPVVEKISEEIELLREIRDSLKK